jgi:uncharacterized protein HemX
MELNMGTIATSLIGAAIIGGVTSFWGLQQKTTIQEQKIIQIEKTLQEVKEEQEKKLDRIIEKLDQR